MDYIAMAEILEAQAACLRREGDRKLQAGQAELALDAGDGWNEWAGGDEQPVPTYGKSVDVRLRDETELNGPASGLLWSHTSEGGDIVAWRLAAEQPEG